MEEYAVDMVTNNFDGQSRMPRRVVMKVGSRLLAGPRGELRNEWLEALVEVIAAHRGAETVLVSSGAVATGFGALGGRRPSEESVERRAAAAVGQAALIRRYSELFERRGMAIGQVLLTREVLLDDHRLAEVRQTFEALLGAGVLPVVNENDPAATDGHAVGDNDNLASHVATLLGADLLVLLTDVDGVYAGEPGSPGAELIQRAESAAELRRFCWSRPSPESRGGMLAKLEAAERAASCGVPTVIASGVEPSGLASVYGGVAVGTRIEALAPAAANPAEAGGAWADASANGASTNGGGNAVHRRAGPRPHAPAREELPCR